MGKSKTKTEQTNKPVYSAQIEGAANTVNQAYQAQAPKISGIADQFLGTSQNLLDRYNEGNPATTAANDYIQSTLSSDSGNNPHLQSMIDLTNRNTALDLNTYLGTRGNLGSSVQTDLLSRALADNELGYRYDDYNNQENRKLQAAGLLPSVTAAEYEPLSQALQVGQFGAFAPIDAATANANTTAGLLGQYQDVNGTQTQSGGLLGQILGAAGQVGGAYLTGG